MQPSTKSLSRRVVRGSPACANWLIAVSGRATPTHNSRYAQRLAASPGSQDACSSMRYHLPFGERQLLRNPLADMVCVSFRFILEGQQANLGVSRQSPTRSSILAPPRSAEWKSSHWHAPTDHPCAQRFHTRCGHLLPRSVESSRKLPRRAQCSLQRSERGARIRKPPLARPPREACDTQLDKRNSLPPSPPSLHTRHEAHRRSQCPMPPPTGQLRVSIASYSVQHV